MWGVSDSEETGSADGGELNWSRHQSTAMEKSIKNTMLEI